jgi:type I restriction enzyme, R subunit
VIGCALLLAGAEDVRKLPYRNLALEVLRKLLNDEIKLRGQRNLIQGRRFSDMLEVAIRKYQNRSLEAAEVITELIQIAKEIRAAKERGERLGLDENEEAFFDALEVNDSAVKVLGEENLKGIARELVETVRNNVGIDWTSKEKVRAKLRLMVKRVLKRHGYPPDKQEKATQTVLQQAELLCATWT